MNIYLVKPTLDTTGIFSIVIGQVIIAKNRVRLLELSGVYGPKESHEIVFLGEAFPGKTEEIVLTNYQLG